jgi:hypothetical protein
MESFFTKAFYLLQEVAGLAKLSSIDFRFTPPSTVVRNYIPPNLNRRHWSRRSDFSKNRKHVRALFPKLTDVTERAEL